MVSFEKNPRYNQPTSRKQPSPTTVPAMSNQSRLQFYTECSSMPIQFASPTPEQIEEQFEQLTMADEELNVDFTYDPSEEEAALPDFMSLLPDDEVVWEKIEERLPEDKRADAQDRVLQRLASLSPMEKYILYTYVPKLLGIIILPSTERKSCYNPVKNQISIDERTFSNDRLGIAYALFHELGHSMDSLVKTDLEKEALDCINSPAYCTVSSASVFSQEFYDALCTDYKQYRDNYHNVIVPDKINPPKDEDIAPLLQSLIIRRVYYDHFVNGKSHEEMITHIQEVCSFPIPKQLLYLRELRTVENFKWSIDPSPAAAAASPNITEQPATGTETAHPASDFQAFTPGPVAPKFTPGFQASAPGTAAAKPGPGFQAFTPGPVAAKFGPGFQASSPGTAAAKFSPGFQAFTPGPAAAKFGPGFSTFGSGTAAAKSSFSMPACGSGPSPSGLDAPSGPPIRTASMPAANPGQSSLAVEQKFGILAKHITEDIIPEESDMSKSHQDHSLEHAEPDAPPSQIWTQGIQDIFSYFTFQLQDAGMRFSVTHSDDHWDGGPDKVTQEAFAHFFEAHSNQAELNYLKEFLPNAYKVYNKMIEEMTRGTIRKYSNRQQTPT